MLPFWQSALLRTQGVDLAWFPSTKLLIEAWEQPYCTFLQKQNRFPADGRRWINTVLLNKSWKSCVPCPGQEDTLTCQSQQEQRQERPEGSTSVFPTYPTRSRAEQRHFAIQSLLLYKRNLSIMERPVNEWEAQMPKNISFIAEGTWWCPTKKSEKENYPQETIR